MPGSGSDLPCPLAAAAPPRRPHGSGGRPSRAEAARIASRILDTAKTLFLRNGFGKVSMDAIASELGMSKRTLYARFPTKSDLFAAVAVHVLEQPLAALEAFDLPGRSPREQILEAARRFVAMALEPDLVALDRVATAEVRHAPDLGRRVHEHAVERSVEVMSGLLSRGGFMPGASAAEIRRDAQMLLEFVILPPLRAAVLALPDTDEAEGALLQRASRSFSTGSAAAGRDRGPSARTSQSNHLMK